MGKRDRNDDQNRQDAGWQALFNPSGVAGLVPANRGLAAELARENAEQARDRAREDTR